MKKIHLSESSLVNFCLKRFYNNTNWFCVELFYSLLLATLRLFQLFFSHSFCISVKNHWHLIFSTTLEKVAIKRQIVLPLLSLFKGKTFIAFLLGCSFLATFLRGLGASQFTLISTCKNIAKMYKLKRSLNQNNLSNRLDKSLFLQL